MKETKEELDFIVEEAHRYACSLKLRTYTDPFTQADVFTRFYLEDRGFCCQQGCRHCPYEEVGIKLSKSFEKK